MIEYRTPTADDVAAIVRRDEQAFVAEYTEAEREALSSLLPLDRFRIAVDGPDLVGVAGSWSMELTLPGGALVPMGGTTWVAVAPTHRRQGILRRLMDQVHRDMVDRTEVAAGLQASEGAIYERFGYGAATRWRTVSIDRRRTQMVEAVRLGAESVRLIEPLEHLDTLAEIYDRYRRARVGEVARSATWIEMRIRKERTTVWGALHPDGYALWTMKEDWNNFDARHEMRIRDLVAATPEAHTALWNLVLSHDLVGPIRCSPAVSLDDRLPYLLTDPRAVRTTTLNDFLWLCPLDVGALAAARRYRIDGSIVIEVDGERWSIEGGSDGAHASRSAATAELTMTRSAFGSLLLGGVSASELAAGGRLDGSALSKADAFFGWSPLPHCSTPF